LRCAAEGIDETIRDLSGFDQIHFQQDLSARTRNGIEHGRKECIAIDQ